MKHSNLDVTNFSAARLGAYLVQCLLLLFILAVQPAVAQSVRQETGVTTATYPAGTVLSTLSSGGRVGVWHRGWWHLSGASKMQTVWNILEPTDPVRVGQAFDRPMTTDSYGHDYHKIGDLFRRHQPTSILRGQPTHYLDLSQLPKLKPYLGQEPAPDFDLHHGGHYAETFFYPYQKELREFNFQTVSGINATGKIVIGNLLILFPRESEHGVATWDISDPDRPVLLDVMVESVHQYTTSGHIYQNNLLLVGRSGVANDQAYEVVIIDFSDPTDLRISHTIPNWPGRSVHLQNEYGFSSNAWWGWKYNFATHAVELEFFPPAQSNFMDFFWLPVGHLLLGSGDSHAHVVAHDDDLDTRPPFVAYHLPADGAVNQAVTSRIGLVIHETLDATTVDDSNIIVRPVGGEPISGLVSVTASGVINFGPYEPLTENTTYEVVLREGGIVDAAGNGIEPFSFRFSTGSVSEGIDDGAGPVAPQSNPPPNVSLLAFPVQGEAPLMVNFNASLSSDPDGDPLSYRWDFGDGTSGAGVQVSHTYASAGEYQARLVVDDGRGGTDTRTTLISVASTGLAGAAGKTLALNRDSSNGDALEAQGASANPYDLGVLPAEFAGLRWPEAPAITSEVTVSNATQLAAALTTNGARIIVRPGVYALRLSVRGSDQDIVFQEGAIIAPSDATALFISGARRIVIRGGSFQGGMSVQGQSSDVLLDGVSINTKRNSDPIWPDTAELTGGLSRIAIINSTVSSKRSTAYSDNIQDLIYANNDFMSDGFEATMRLQRVTRAVIVDNRLWNGGIQSKHTFRAHDSSDLVYFARNQVENTGIMFNNMTPLPSVLRIWMIDNTLYGDVGIQTGNNQDMEWLEATGNTLYVTSCSNPVGCGEAIVWQSGWGTVENNLQFPYQEPPAW